MVAADKGLAFTASSTGQFAVRVKSAAGSGPMTVTVRAVGTALRRAISADLSGHPIDMGVGCAMSNCAFWYSSADSDMVLDSDGKGFELRVQVKQAGTSIAIDLAMGQGQHTGVQTELTSFVSEAVAGAAAFLPSLKGAMAGPWTRSPAGHHSWAEHRGCSNNDAQCIATRAAVLSGWGVYPGGETFPRRQQGTVVIPTAAAMLLRIKLNCDVPFYADVEAPSCYASDGKDASAGSYAKNFWGPSGPVIASLLSLSFFITFYHFLSLFITFYHCLVSLSFFDRLSLSVRVV
jgi:hypothetical protein